MGCRHQRHQRVVRPLGRLFDAKFDAKEGERKESERWVKEEEKCVRGLDDLRGNLDEEVEGDGADICRGESSTSVVIEVSSDRDRGDHVRFCSFFEGRDGCASEEA